MKLIYTPEGEPAREWTVLPVELLSFQTDWLEECGGDTWDTYDDWARLVWAGNRKALRALLYVMLRAENPDLRFPYLVIRVSELAVEWERTDLDIDATREKIMNDTELSAERRAELLAELDADPKDEDGTVTGPDDSVTNDSPTGST